MHNLINYPSQEIDAPVAGFQPNVMRLGDQCVVPLQDVNQFISRILASATPGETQPALLKLTEVARILNVSRFTLNRFIKESGLPCLRIGAVVRIPSEELWAWVAEHTARTSAA